MSIVVWVLCVMLGVVLCWMLGEVTFQTLVLGVNLCKMLGVVLCWMLGVVLCSTLSLMLFCVLCWVLCWFLGRVLYCGCSADLRCLTGGTAAVVTSSQSTPEHLTLRGTASLPHDGSSPSSSPGDGDMVLCLHSCQVVRFWPAELDKTMLAM